MSNQPPYPYDPQYPYGGGQSQGENPQGGSAQGGYPPSYEPGNQGGYPPPYTPQNPPQPPDYGQPNYQRPEYEQPGSPGAYPPPPGTYTGPYSQPYPQPPTEPQPPPYAPPYGQPVYPQGQYQGQYPSAYQAPYQGPYAAPYAQYGAAIPQQDSRAGLAIAALILGILSLVFSCANICDTPFIVLALIFGFLGLQSTTRRSLAVWGLITAGIALVIAVAFVAYAVSTHNFQFSPGPYTP